MNILLTCAGRRNYLVNYFKDALNGNGEVVATDNQISAPALAEADVAIQVPLISDPKYIDILFEICRKRRIDAIISLNDLELPLLSTNKLAFKELGVTAIVSDPSVIDTCFDKWKTYLFLKHINVNAPKTYLSLSEATAALEQKEIEFPLVIKPRWGSASIGIEVVESHHELQLAYELLGIRLKRTILAEASSGSDEPALLIQEKLQGEEYGMDVLNDFNGNYVASFAKKKLAMRDGETDKAQLKKQDRFTALGKKIGSNLKQVGNLDMDVFDTHDGLFVLELNPRFGGGYPFTHEGGVNIPAILIQWLSGSNDIEQYLSFSPELSFAKCDKIVEVLSEYDSKDKSIKSLLPS